MPRHSEVALHDDDVDVTNLIDLLVVLCALLMLLMPAITSFREVNGLVQTEGNGVADATMMAETPIVRFAADGTYQWNDVAITRNDLERRRPEQSEQRIFLAGDPQAPYGDSVLLRMTLHKNGWKVQELAQPERSADR